MFAILALVLSILRFAFMFPILALVLSTLRFMSMFPILTLVLPTLRFTFMFPFLTLVLLRRINNLDTIVLMFNAVCCYSIIIFDMLFMHCHTEVILMNIQITCKNGCAFIKTELSSQSHVVVVILYIGMTDWYFPFLNKYIFGLIIFLLTMVID